MEVLDVWEVDFDWELELELEVEGFDKLVEELDGLGSDE